MRLSLEQHLEKYWMIIDKHSIANAKMSLGSKIRECKSGMKYVFPGDTGNEIKQIYREDLRNIYRALAMCINR